jgi:S-adenosylmethionine:tRNA ribosyltransferase-isomerase
MKLSQFKFRLPDEKIALYPRTYNPETKFYNRDEAKLMVVHKKTGEIEHRIFKEITDYFEEGDAFVFNDTRVFPARLYGNKERRVRALRCFSFVNSMKNSVCGMCWLTLPARFV